MSGLHAGRRGGARAVATLIVLGALAAGCSSSDDDDGDPTDPGTTDGGDAGGTTGGMTGGGMTGGGTMGGGMEAGDGTFAEILERGPADEPVDFDAAALSTDLEAIFGMTADEPMDGMVSDGVDDGADGDDNVTGSRRRATAY